MTPTTLVSAPAVPAISTGTVAIVFATESGNAHSVAQATRKAIASLGLEALVLDTMDVTPAQVSQASTVLIVAATAGEGDPPDRGADFYAALMADDAPSFNGTSFAVLALGDRAYPNFCGHGEHLDERLEALGGTRLEGLVRCDFEYEADASAWILRVTDALTPSGTDAATVEIETPGVAVSATITMRHLLHHEDADRQSVHLTMRLDPGVEYAPGDILDIVPRNDQAVVDDLLDAAGISDPELSAMLRTDGDVTTLTADTLIALATRPGTNSKLASFADDRESAADFAKRSRLVDALRSAGRRLTRAELLALLRPMAPRSYSISSSPLAQPGHVDLLVAEMRWDEQRDAHGVRRGVASDDLITRRRVGESIPVRVKPNPHFHLPQDSATDIIMIGAGSGVAPFRGFVQHRALTRARGRNWLFFGHRRSEFDFLYEQEWRSWTAGGFLARLDTAFSRDQDEKLYVQHAIWNRREDVARWVADGASIYICGDRGMGSDVEQTLDRALAPLALDCRMLARQLRLFKDTY